MRRKDREMDNNEMERMLMEAYVCRIGLCTGNVPYIVPMNFGYRHNAIYLHSALEGRKIEILRKNPTVCFEIDEPGKLITGEKACDWTMRYKSVIGTAKAVIIENENMKREALDIIMQKFSGRNKHEYSDAMLKRTCILRLDIIEISGKESV